MDLSWLPSLVCFMLGIIILGLTFKRAIMKNKIDKHVKQSSWQEQLELEHKMQFSRSRTLPKQLFLSVDFTTFPSVSEEKCQTMYLKLLAFADRPMVNLKGKTNLELKQNFGPQCIEILSGYEKNYFEFMDICCQYGSILLENDFIHEARQVLEQALSYQCDITKCYLLLIEIYTKLNEKDALIKLRSIAMVNMEHSPFLSKVLDKIG